MLEALYRLFVNLFLCTSEKNMYYSVYLPRREHINVRRLNG
jgi:hypothetical protein